MNEQPPSLSYACPRVFYECRADPRHVAMLLIAFGLLGFAVLAAVAMQDKIGTSPLEAGFFALMAVLMLVGAGGCIYAVVRPRDTLLRITEDGIKSPRGFYPWSRIIKVGGTTDDLGRIWMSFSVGLGRITLLTRPALTDQQFADVIAELEPFLREQHPLVKVVREPVSDG